MIPLVANLAPIAWFSGASLKVTTLDKRFADSLGEVREIFARDHTSVGEGDSSLDVERLVHTPASGPKHAMLFSGGVDAYATFFRHRDENLDLVSIHGADIPIDDEAQWQTLVDLTAREPVLAPHPKRHIESNLLGFYTYHVNLLVESKAWWGTVQHGLALNALVAPLGNARGYSKVYIASSYTESIQIKWGSTPEIDNSIAWSGCEIVHDGYELQRIDKIDLIATESEAGAVNIKLRVCYSELNYGLNCSSCEKCFRTILGISLSGVNPGAYGFSVGSDAYTRISELVKCGFATAGSRYFWWELHERMLTVPAGDAYLLGSEGDYERLKNILAQQLESPVQAKSLSTTKMALIAKFPKLFSIYLSVRRWFS